MRAGILDQRVTLKRRTVTGQDTFGQDIISMVTVATVWAAVRYLSGRELDQAQQTFAEARYEIEMRRRPDLTIKRADTVEWRGQTLDILDVAGPGTREDSWKILAKDHVE